MPAASLGSKRKFVPLPRPAYNRVRVFCDLDGVLTDFDKGLEKAGVTQSDLKHNPGESWKTLENVSGFYQNLSWMKDGKELWNTIKVYQPIILTGLPRGTWAEPQKRKWCERHLGRDVVVITCMAAEKQQLSAAGNVLIDDTPRNCAGWSKQGGDAIFHRSLEETTAELKRIFDLAAPVAKPPNTILQPPEKLDAKTELEKHIARLEEVLRVSRC
eukprot:TRINITY_DN19326_c0_g1_i1.p1 TRINITY_DN19326_c0_g1~~TRINITY_DN19326_c0_g1_i1.p1  ORF type:complete len:215 (+),score=45.18 TRINITY_DN19326_c0_g1_i1:52-696(+)